MGRLNAFWLAFACTSPALADFDAASYPPYERCALCHGLFGQSHNAKFPHLAGQKPEYIKAQLDAFLAGARTNDGGQMAAIVTELKAEEIPVVVEWFSTQEPPSPKDALVNATGQQKVEALGCLDCHNDDAGFVPHLTAQHAGYLEKQLNDFATGARSERDVAGMHQEILRPVMDKVSDIAAYLAALEPSP